MEVSPEVIASLVGIIVPIPVQIIKNYVVKYEFLDRPWIPYVVSLVFSLLAGFLVVFIQGYQFESVSAVLEASAYIIAVAQTTYHLIFRNLDKNDIID